MSLRGHIDRLDRMRLEGWAQWLDRPDETVMLAVLVDGKQVTRLCADRPRDDLREAGIGSGEHAFEFQFPQQLTSDEAHVISVLDESGVAVPGTPISLAAVRPLQGHLDAIGRYRLQGWAYSPDRPAVTLIIRANGRIVARVLANRFRNDLKEANIGMGRHAFEVELDAPLSPIEGHTIEVFREDDGVHLPGSPAFVAPADRFDQNARQAIEDILGKFGTDEDVQQKISFLAERLTSLVQRQADIDSKAELRERNRRLLQRWSRREIEQLPTGTSEIKRALVIDNWLPRPDQDAGSAAIVSHIHSLKRLGYEVTLAAAHQFVGNSPVEDSLSDVTIAAPPVYGSVEEVLLRQRNQFDLIYLHRIDNAAKYLHIARGNNPKARLVFSVADLHHLRIARQSKVEDNHELQGYSEYLKLTELVAARLADAVITHSSMEAAYLRKHLPGAQIHVVRWDTRTQPVRTPFGARRGVAFVGSYGHAPNLDAAKWLIRDIMPRVRKRDPEVTCFLVGPDFPHELKSAIGDGIEVLGHVASLSDVFERVRLTVAPVEFGAGLKGKVLESLAAGVPCICTPIAAEGFDFPNELAPCIASTEQELGKAILQLHRNENLNRRIGRTAAEFAAQHFSSDALDTAMRQVVGGKTRLERVLESSPGLGSDSA
ncbi:glycosyltransferase family 4 protein [Bradyrhizobium guangzhouense]|uniref:glycosyltransferase family 4 protein n=1 Tax=Bradyrhizobium guangzhouense TaxID=1325095 RepID=UPI001009F621|nr:glycosyltransferase family 4 protein [Bradyrhizobium guangzhouense]RXH10106.1 glycosyltransferase [Bradyrhizobium guangzhouense]